MPTDIYTLLFRNSPLPTDTTGNYHSGNSDSKLVIPHQNSANG